MGARAGSGGRRFASSGVLLFAALTMPAAAQLTSRVSVASGGAQGGGDSFVPSFSADGRYVAFASVAGNLVGGDTNATTDVFVRDRQSGTTERVSVATGGAQGNGASTGPLSISSDGRYVAFSSAASNLVGADTNTSSDVFVRDRLAGTTERVSVATGGAQGNGQSHEPAISSDGRYVAFHSGATNLVVGDTNGFRDIFVRDRMASTTERVSLTAGGAQGTGGASNSPSVSGDARYVAFQSYATNLVAGDSNAAPDIFVRDRQTGTTERVSVHTNGAQGNDASGGMSISANGRYVSFESAATNLAAGDTNGFIDVFVRDRFASATERASIASGGAQGNGHSSGGYTSVSSDGRYVAFVSDAGNLVSGDTNGASDVFVRDRQSGTTKRVSVSSGGTQGNDDSLQPAISGNGRYVAFRSDATNLVAGDTNFALDVFVHDGDAGSFTSLCDPGSGGVVGCPCGNPPSGPGRGCDNHGASSGGATIAGSGNASLTADTVLLSATNENNTALTVFWTGSNLIAPPGGPHGAGVRCVSALHRLYFGNASGGAIARPGGGDPSVSAASASVGATITAGQTRYYFTIYRDPLAAGPCGNPASGINLTNLTGVTWGF